MSELILSKNEDSELVGLAIAVALFAESDNIRPPLEDDDAEIAVGELSDPDLFDWEIDQAIEAAVVMPPPAEVKATTAKPSTVDDGWDRDTEIQPERRMIITEDGPMLTHR